MRKEVIDILKNNLESIGNVWDIGGDIKIYITGKDPVFITEKEWCEIEDFCPALHEVLAKNVVNF